MVVNKKEERESKNEQGNFDTAYPAREEEKGKGHVIVISS